MSDEMKPDLPTTTEDTSNTALDVVTDLTLDATIPAPIRKNAFKAFDRLCSALIDIPVGALERKSAEKRAESEARIKIIRENADQIAQQMKVDPEYARIAVSKYGKKILREQVNLDKISAIAANELKNEESDSLANQGNSESNKEQSADSTNQGTNGSEEKTIDDDWLNVFETEARQKSTEEMQLRFGRILAGEIRQSGSYSIKAVKLLGELDQDTASLFKKLCSACVTLEIPYSDREGMHVLDARVPSLGGNAGSNALSKYGLGFEQYLVLNTPFVINNGRGNPAPTGVGIQWKHGKLIIYYLILLDQLNLLNEYNLIISDYNSQFPYNFCIVNQDNPGHLAFKHQERRWLLLSKPERSDDSEFRLSGVALSYIGRELSRIVNQDPMPEYTEDLKQYFAKQKLQMVEVSIQ